MTPLTTTPVSEFGIGTAKAVRRRGLAALLFWIVRPEDARAAVVNASALQLTFAFRTREIPFGDIETVEIGAGWWWSRVHIQHSAGKATVSGLLHDDAAALRTALETAWVGWWRAVLAAHGGTLRSIHEHLTRFGAGQRYMRHSVSCDLEREGKEVVGQFGSRWPDALAADPGIRALEAIRGFLDDPGSFRAKARETFVGKELDRSREFLDRVETRPLTDEQRRAVVVDEDRNLVVAAAGSGKTSVIVAKAGWQIRRGYRRPSELLLLAFAKEAQKELEERVRGRLGDEVARGVTVRTFHSLGMSIIGSAEGKRPPLARAAEDDRVLEKLLEDAVAKLFADRQVSSVLRSWFGGFFVPYRSVQEFRSWGDYYNYIRRYGVRTLKDERVKSFEEREIANFLYLNGVPYIYEHPYEHDVATSKKRQYQPDFYLLDAGIYIEHFGINDSGGTALFVNTKEYLSDMEWKRGLHKDYGTVLVETFSYERPRGALIDNLARNLIALGVPLSPIPADEVFARLRQGGWISRFVGLVKNFLHHFKGGQFSFSEVARRAAKDRDHLRREAFLKVFRPIFEHYQQGLADRGEIDFHDMVGKATEHVETGRYRSPFGYILVDEFQDISPDRARLLKALLDQAPAAQLFAVGDDWQAIYRFAGSDIAIMREFKERFGASERIDLETTFRCVDPIAKVATEFILCNPAQMRKTVRSTRQVNGPCVHIGFPGAKDASLLDDALDRITADAEGYGGTSEVLLLGRYRHIRPKNMRGLARKYRHLRMSFNTAHGSKGLEADYVVVLGLCMGKYGFPSEIEDDPLLNLVLAAPEEHPNAEERRLFYVAITRAKRRVFLLADGGPPSPFIWELSDGNYDIEVFGCPPEVNAPCPECVEGRLRRRESTKDKRTFYGCSNFPLCEYKQSSCPACGKGLMTKAADGGFRCRDCSQPVDACPGCKDGWLRPRKGPHGSFFGCSTWPECSYTRNIQ